MDNNFAGEFLLINQPDIPQPALSGLCGDCSNISSRDFSCTVTSSQLSKTAESCELCKMLRHCLDLDQTSVNDQKAITLFRFGSMLRASGRELPVLRICIGPGT
jgi:hypothetical protein